MAAAAAVQAAKALGVHRHELARDGHVEAAEAPRRLGEQMREPMRTVPAQDPVDARGRKPEDRPDAIGTPALLEAQREHARFEGIGRTPRRPVRPARPVGEVGGSMAPAIDRPSADPEVPGCPANPDPL